MFSEIHDSEIEKRAHAPAISHFLERWHRLAQKREGVPFACFDPRDLGDLADDMIVLVPTGDGDFIYASFGARVAECSGGDMTGRRCSERNGPAGVVFATSNRRALEEGRPIFTIHQRASETQVQMWERLVLPCKDSDGGDILVLYCRIRDFRQDLLGALLDASLDAILAVRILRDAAGQPIDGHVIAANRRAAQIADRPLEAFSDARLLNVLPNFAINGVWQRCLDVAASRSPVEYITRYQHRSQGERWYEVAIAPLGDGFMLTYSDITERRQAEETALRQQREHAEANAALKAEIVRRQALEVELQRLATCDPLTGALNRRAITERLQKALLAAERYGHALTVATFDLDHFKAINDTFGHAAGDAVLKACAALVTHGLREDVDIFGRLGGEEFVAVLPQTDLTAAAAVAERLRRLVTECEVPIEGHVVRFSASFGLAAWDGRETMDRLLSRSDTALYRAKSAGRNVVCVDEGTGEWIVARVPGTEAPPLAAEPSPFHPTARRNGRPRRAKAI